MACNRSGSGASAASVLHPKQLPLVPMSKVEINPAMWPSRQCSSSAVMMACSSHSVVVCSQIAYAVMHDSWQQYFWQV